MKNNNLKKMVFVALYAALAIVLDYVKEFIPFTSIWANGGSIDIALIPLVFAAFHLGWQWGVVTALVQFVASIAVGATHLWFATYNPVVGFLCDYIVPAVIMGVSSFLIGKEKKFDTAGIIKAEVGIALTGAIRILSQVVSGAYCWMEDGVAAGSSAAWDFSLGYNVSYGIPTMVMLLIVMPLLLKAFEKQINK